MARRTKEELLQSNYYEWIEICNKLREQKKSGFKLTPAEKALLKTIPTHEDPYKPAGAQPEQVVKKKKPIKVKIDFDKTVMWPVKGGSFLCGVFNIPRTDEDCLVLCDREDCPFYGKGYFRTHGIKF